MRESRAPLEQELPFAPPPAPPAAVTARIRQTVAEDLRPRSVAEARRRAWATAALFLLAIALPTALSRWTLHVESAPLASALYGVIGWSVVMGGVLLVGLVRPPGRRGSRAARLLLALLVPALFLAWLLVVSPYSPYTSAAGPRALECFQGASVLGGLTTLGTLWLWRKTDPLSPRLSGALAGLIGGLASGTAMGVVCPTTDLFHVSVAHGLVLIAFVLAGALLGKKVIAP